VDIGGILIITDGTGSNIADLAVAFHRPGGLLVPLNYVGQAIATLSAGGQRTNGRWVAPCVNGCIEWAWCRGDVDQWPDKPLTPAYPEGAAYGLNLTVQAIYLP
jgi:hypothetical protein